MDKPKTDASYHTAPNAPSHTTHIEHAAQLALANIASGKGGPFGCVIVQDGRVVAAAANNVLGNTDPTAHAEVETIRLAAKNLGRVDLADCVLYSSAEPCPMCLAAIYWARIPVFYYANTKAQAAAIGFDDAHFYKELAKPIAERSVQAIHIPSQTATDAFATWDAHSGKIMY